MQETKINRMKEHIVFNIRKTLSSFTAMLPIIIAVVLLTGLLLKFISTERISALFGQNDWLDALSGATVGSIAAGHPITSYVLGGELLASGVSLVAVTALLVSWVTVGVVQLPAEALILGKRFAIYRNLLCFVFSILIAVLSIMTLRFMI